MKELNKYLISDLSNIVNEYLEVPSCNRKFYHQFGNITSACYHKDCLYIVQNEHKSFQFIKYKDGIITKNKLNLDIIAITSCNDILYGRCMLDDKVLELDDEFKIIKVHEYNCSGCELVTINNEIIKYNVSDSSVGANSKYNYLEFKIMEKYNLIKIIMSPTIIYGLSYNVNKLELCILEENK